MINNTSVRQFELKLLPLHDLFYSIGHLTVVISDCCFSTAFSL